MRFAFNLIRIKNRVDSVNPWNIKKRFRWEYTCILKRLDLRTSPSGQKQSLQKVAVRGFSIVFSSFSI